MAATESLNIVRSRIGERLAEIEAGMPSLAPRVISKRMDAIRSIAADHGMGALAGLADYAAHHAMMPGHRVATRTVLAHMDEAMASDGRASECEAVLAAVALRLH